MIFANVVLTDNSATFGLVFRACPRVGELIAVEPPIPGDSSALYLKWYEVTRVRYVDQQIFLDTRLYNGTGNLR